MTNSERNTPVRIDFGPIQQPLKDLAETIAQKVRREGPSLLSAPLFVAPTMFVMIRHAIYTCNLLFYINADERRASDCYWNPAYTFVTAPLVRTLIDCLYNLPAILQNPSLKGAAYCRSGFKKEIGDLEEDERRYGGQPDWDSYVRDKRDKIDTALAQYGFAAADVAKQAPWPTLGQYIRELGPGGSLSPHQAFLKTFTYGMWREYSAMAHGGFEGLLDTVSVYTRDAIPHDSRPQLDDIHNRLMSMHMIRAAAVLLCIVTELQVYFRFDGANINSRIHQVWNAMLAAFEVKELYDERYAELMASKGIRP